MSLFLCLFRRPDGQPTFVNKKIHKMSANHSTKRRVAYFYNHDIGNYYYGPGHPMKPHRLKMTHNLLLTYGLYKKMDVFRPHWASREEMTKFHSQEYIDFLQKVSPETVRRDLNEATTKFNVGESTDCPVFDGLFDYCSAYTGATLDGARMLNHNLKDICINWAGGLHHAKKSEASGFCYVNDIVLGILELLKHHSRVLYIDIDIHHGDGVEEAFYVTDRVMTCSFHKHGDFFPGTGAQGDIGSADGKYYSVNVPLDEGMDDDSFAYVFKPVIQSIMTRFQPGAIVLQCGADSLTGDRLGCFNLTLKGHANCVQFVKSFGIPVLVLGGGGYTIKNVARLWTYETSVLVGEEIADTIPYNDFYEQYKMNNYKLHLTPTAQVNKNTKERLDMVLGRVLRNLNYLRGAPSVQVQEVPPDYPESDASILARERADDVSGAQAVREGIHTADTSKKHHEAEYYDGPNDQDGEGGGGSADVEMA